MRFLTRNEVFNRMQNNGHTVFQNDKQDYNLNIVSIRSKDAKLDEFGCQLMVAWKYQGVWHDESFRITTYPGSYYLIDKLLNSKGTAILAPGQYKGIYSIRLHNGKYEALCQTYGPVKVFRDGNRDRKFDLRPSHQFWGDYGINYHRSVISGVARKVGSYSAGCQVFASIEEFNYFMTLCRKARDIYGNKFTTTLIDQ